MRTALFAGALLAAGALAAPSVAHHSPGAIYDLDAEVTVEGEVTRFQLGNPHVRVYFTRTAEDGTTSDWMGEGGSRTVLMRRGWKEEDLAPGDHVIITGNPAHDEDAPIVHIKHLTLPNGETRYAEDLLPDALGAAFERQREEAEAADADDE